ncbi:hypothetical protein QUA35_29175 [Microcoleus sp. N9_B2]|uniref:hypothetical protein n=1 Tax=unclassified Microcoleus TaxID=2642155 RepID=UPI002FCFA102
MTHLNEEKKAVETAADFSPCLKPGACVSLFGQFVFNPAWKAITSEQQELMSRMLLERISQAGIARVLQVSEDTVQR